MVWIRSMSADDADSVSVPAGISMRELSVVVSSFSLYSVLRFSYRVLYAGIVRSRVLSVFW